MKLAQHNRNKPHNRMETSRNTAKLAQNNVLCCVVEVLLCWALLGHHSLIMHSYRLNT